MKPQNQYTFPFNTCEKVNKGGLIAQPYSSFINLLSCLIIFYYLIQTTTSYTFAFLLSIFCFDVFHTLSHINHIPGPIQTNIIHTLAYCVNISLLYLFTSYTKIVPTYEFMGYLLGLVLIDIYALYSCLIIIYISIHGIFMISLLYYYFPLLPKQIQNSFYPITVLIFTALILIVNEFYNGEWMMSINADFPYHALIELVGLVLFDIISSNFYNL